MSSAGNHGLLQCRNLQLTLSTLTLAEALPPWSCQHAQGIRKFGVKASSSAPSQNAKVKVSSSLASQRTLLQEMENYSKTASELISGEKGQDSAKQVWKLRTEELQQRGSLVSALSRQTAPEIIGLAEHNPILAPVVADAAVMQGLSNIPVSKLCELCRAVGCSVRKD